MNFEMYSFYLHLTQCMFLSAYDTLVVAHQSHGTLIIVLLVSHILLNACGINRRKCCLKST